jgi:glycosyltransferase involved in cell wall biosynthesis
MNVLFLTIGKLNSIEDKGLYADLLRQFHQDGHKVYVISPRERRFNELTEHFYENGVEFVKVRIGNITKTNLIEKGISTLLIEHLYLKAINRYLKNVKFDLLIYSTPPITFNKVIEYVKKRTKAKSYLLLKDIFPQNAVDLQMFSGNGLIYRFFRNKEKRLYANSDYIGCMSQANVQFILKHNPEILPESVEVCPNSIEPRVINKDVTNIAKIRMKYQIPLNKTVFIYGGNLGKPQGIDFLVECLDANRENEKVYFVIAGSGTEFKKLQAFFENKKPNNAQLLSYLPKYDYELLANSCDVGLIFLDKRFTIPNFPSRLLAYMNASIPVLAATDVNTDLGRVIESGDFGFWCESGDVKMFNDKLEQLCNRGTRERMGNKARKYLEDNYTAKHSYNIIMRHFE